MTSLLRCARAAIRELWPEPCLLCGGHTDCGAQAVCAGCGADLPWLGTAHINVRGAADEVPTAYAPAGPLPVWSALPYLWPVDGLIRRAKFHGDIATARGLGRLLVQGGPPAPDVPGVLLPTPLYWRRHGERGYNQAEEIARGAASVIGWPVVGALIRLRDTTPQTGLSARERRRNLARAFAVRSGRLPRDPAVRLVLVDDVVTTGASIAAMAAALRQAGATRVEAWTVARTP